jgi:Flp pilus assembly protein TadG
MAGSSRRDDRGDTTTQLVLITPVVLVLVLLVVQLALFLHASNVGAAAAHRAVAAGAVLGASAADGRRAAEELAGDAGARLVGAPTVERSAGVVRARVSVRVHRLVPGLPTSVTRTAVAPVERFVPEPER